MSLNFIALKEQENIIPIKLEGKEQYYLDLMNIEHSWTGRIDVFWSNNFFREAVQLVINAITLFEKGYFDCAFYSLRQSLELSTTVVYFVDDCEDNRNREIRKWKNQDRFPMNKQMITDLQNRQAVFADIKDKMTLYFQEIEETKQKLNKYVHKQGYEKFYIWRTNPVNKPNGQEKLVSDFNAYLIKCMGAIAVLRLAVDPFPLLLADEDIYNRTGQLMTEGYTEDFIEKYIGVNHIEAYKQTELYKSHYEGIIAGEEMLPPVVNVVKDEYVDRTKIDEILSQRHLLSNNDLVAMLSRSFVEVELTPTALS